MKPVRLLPAFALCLSICFPALQAQEKGTWRAASTNARGVTGDIAFAGTKIAINFSGFTVAQIRELTPAETSAAFNLEGQNSAGGNLYRTSIPAEKTFLHKNTLCGSEETQWIATYVSGKTLQLAFFSGPQMPVLTADAMVNTTNLCGTYTYVR